MNDEANQNDGSPSTHWNWGSDLRNSLDAARETTDPELLARMVADILTGQIEDDGEISEELICNKCLPFVEALKLARQWGGRFAHELCNRFDATTEAIEEFSEHFDAIEAEVFIDHPNIGSGARRKLADRVNPGLVVRMIDHNQISAAELGKYVNHKNAFVRASVASTAKDQKLLTVLANDAENSVRDAAVNNPAISVEIVEKLAIRGDSLTAKVVAAVRTSKPAVLMELAKKLSNREDVHVAREIMNNKFAPECETTRAAKSLAALF